MKVWAIVNYLDYEGINSFRVFKTQERAREVLKKDYANHAKKSIRNTQDFIDGYGEYYEIEEVDVEE